MDRRVIGLVAFGGALLVVVVIVLIAQGGDDSDGGSTVADAGEKPTVEVPEGPPPTELQIEDLESGSGDEATTGDQVSVQYVGVLYDTGEEFDSSWDRGEPFQFQLGSGQVIPGWDQGVVGMKVGGRRQLIIPPDLAYGAQGYPPDIPPDATLIFDIDLKKIG